MYADGQVFLVWRKDKVIVSAYHIKVIVMVIKVWSVLIIKKKGGGGWRESSISVELIIFCQAH